MKKFILSLAAAVLCTSAAFADATLTMADQTFTGIGTATMTWTSGDYSFKAEKGAGGTNPTYNSNARDVRVYAKSTLTVSAAGDMTEIKFTLSAQGLKRNTDITASTGTIATQAAGDQYVTWTGNASSVTFTVGTQAVYGTDGSGKAGQFAFNAVSIVGGGNGGTVTPPAVDPAGEGTEASPYNVAKAADLVASGAYDSEEEVYIKAKISALGTFSADYGNYSYFISDLGTTPNQFQVYRGMYFGGEKFTAADQLKVGDEVVLAGKLTEYNGVGQVAQGSKIISLNGQTSGGGVTPPVTGDKGSTADNAYTVAEVIALGADANVPGVWVKGVIVGMVNGQSIKNDAIIGALPPADAAKSNLLLAASADVTDVNACMPLQLPFGAIRDALNLVDNGANLGKELTVKGDIIKYFGVAGVKNPTEYVLGAGGVVPPTPDKDTYELTTSITSGAEYVMVANGKLGTAIPASSTYGRLGLVDVEIVDNKVESVPANAIVITASGAGYSMKDANGRYFGFDGEHKTSFQLYTEECEFTTWNIAFTNGEAAITMTVNGITGQVGVTKGAEGTWYNNIAVSVDATDILLPSLYIKSGSSSIESVTVDENAPVEYFNLQGVRVANPESGLYIRRQGSKVSKVYVR